eukprot:Cvel_21767.t2-p1 / transcript=Cvel_21767.t2 / gene=Cvel_21767 / organism=Chromera_velia_CCMP2878 / gene_product=hypothetical protein / transcript_product=hypothetical protein / location=Cvel_scaffold2070:14398-15605(-) / protein_length=181 / sequence_SO=supercontig / SO=protein_coding / is_pseudo=false
MGVPKSSIEALLRNVSATEVKACVLDMHGVPGLQEEQLIPRKHFEELLWTCRETALPECESISAKDLYEYGRGGSSYLTVRQQLIVKMIRIKKVSESQHDVVLCPFSAVESHLRKFGWSRKIGLGPDGEGMATPLQMVVSKLSRAAGDACQHVSWREGRLPDHWVHSYNGCTTIQARPRPY